MMEACISAHPMAIVGTGDYCRDCVARTPRGAVGHVAWDEVEMLKHGWCSARGQHFNTHVQAPGDELAELHQV